MKIKTVALSVLSFFILTHAYAYTPAELEQRTLGRRAIEAAIWGMPLVNFDAMRQAYFRDAQAHYNDVIYLSQPANWKFQVTTPNNSTNYALFFTNLKNGPVVVEIPPLDGAHFFGSILDAWNTPLVDVGTIGQDKGKGGKYLLLPPNYQSELPAGYIPVYASTYNVYGVLRFMPKSKNSADVENAISLIKKLKIHALNGESKTEYIDIADKPFNGIAPYNINFYTMLDRMVDEELVEPRDISIMGQLATLYVGKNLTFQPNSETEKILKHSISEAHEYMADGFRGHGYLWWPEHQWHAISNRAFATKFSFLMDGRLLIDERAFIFFGAFGAPHNPPPALFLMAFEDSKGAVLSGSNTYKLHVDANVPAKEFWSVVAYDSETAGFITEAPVVGLDSLNPDMRKNADGSADIFFAPEAPPGHEKNWITTKAGKSFFILFRNFSPEQSALDRKSPWILNDLEKIK